MIMAFTRELYRLGFEISPVILCNGVAEAIPGGMLPIVALTQSASFVTGLIGGAINLTDLDKYFCHWRPVQGATMVDYDIFAIRSLTRPSRPTRFWPSR
jgi:hypothetical protein